MILTLALAAFCLNGYDFHYLLNSPYVRGPPRWLNLVTMASDSQRSRDYRRNVDSDCFKSTDFYKCGDICIVASALCFCGPSPVGFTLWAEGSQCCVPASSKAQCTRDEFGHAHCPTGVVTPQSQQCHGQCFNDYQVELFNLWHQFSST